MADLAEIWVIDADSVSRGAIGAFVEAHETYKDICKICDPDAFQAHDDSTVIVLGEIPQKLKVKASIELSKPVRIGALFDGIEKILKKRGRSLDIQEVDLGPWQLDPVHNVLQRGKNKKQTVRLTDKEKDILLLLHQNKGQPVSREDMLKTVWGFVDGVETHTLETHIYRLRQKIEDDPAQAKILLTTESGYILGDV